jgi:C_GCAxxG_C_C family probable redox protein
MFEIRRAVESDLPAARQVLSLCPPPHRVVDDDATADASRSALYVATAGNNLIGCAAFDLIAERHGLIRSHAVLPGFRKQHIGRHLIMRVLAHADESAIDHLYLLTDRAREYFGQLGFISCSADCLPEPVRMAPRFRALHLPGAVLMQRIGEQELCGEGTAAALAAAEAKRQFDAGFYCSESVLLAVGRELGIDSTLLPAIATGFSSGIARSWSTCGAVNGAVLGLNMAFGRRLPTDSVETNYAAVRTLIGEFAQTCGSTQCSELLACDLDTVEGQRIYKTHHLRKQCREYVGIAARLATRIIHDRRNGG